MLSLELMIYDRLLTQYIQFYIMNAIYISRADNPAAITNLMNCYHMEEKKKKKEKTHTSEISDSQQF